MTKKLLSILLLLGAALSFAQAPPAAPAAAPITDADIKGVEAPKPEIRALGDADGSLTGTVADIMPTLPGGTAGTGGGVSTRTLASQGLRDYDLDTIGYILAPAKTPPALIKRLNQHIVQLMSQQDVKDRLAAGGSEAVTGTPEQLAAKLKADDANMRKLFKQIGLSADK